MEWLLLIAIIAYGLYYLSERQSQRPDRYWSPKGNTPAIRPKLNVQQLDISQLELSSEQEKLFDLLENTDNHIFITGKAGTGKSVLLQYFKQKSSKRLVVVAPTGVAALNVGGQTIHSLFRIPPEFITKEKLRLNEKTALLLRNLDCVVIDEISMVRADLMDAIDYLLRIARSDERPFGGVQIVVFGDLYQLSPIVNDPELHKYFSDNHGGYHFFNAHVWRKARLGIHNLSTVFRQKDQKFITILDSIRTGNFTDRLLAQLNDRITTKIPTDGVITLVTTNILVNQINQEKLDQLDGKPHEYRASISGDLERISFPTNEVLKLKKGAQVMLLKNDKEKRWVNGTIGYIENLSSIEVKINIDGFVYSVPRETWNKIRYYYNQETRKIEEEIVSSFTQFPLRLAWAITIHKSQGQTFGSLVLDMGDGAFAHGQTYVALSRCRSLEGLYLKRKILSEDIMVDPSVISFMSRAKMLLLPRAKGKIRPAPATVTS